MTSRRSFFSRIGALVAVVAMAPQIAFSAKLDVQPTLNLQEFFDAVYGNQPHIDIFTDKAGLDALYKIGSDALLESPLAEPVDMKSCGHVAGVYEQLRMAHP